MYSVGQEGRICKWDSKKMDEPLLHLDIYEKNTSSEIAQMEIIPMDFAIARPEARRMLIATFENSVYEVELQDNELKLLYFYEVHDSPVSCIGFLPFFEYAKSLRDQFSDSQLNVNPLVATNCVVTTAFDWKIKIFTATDLKKCQFQLEYHKDFLSCMDINPVNPYLLATADSDGILAVWNLAKKSSSPVFHWKAPHCILRLKWSDNSEMLAVGDIHGDVQLISVKKSLVHLKEEDVHKLIQNEFEISSLYMRISCHLN